MSKLGLGTLIAAAALVGLMASSASHAEDTLNYNIVGGLATQTQPSFMTAIPGSTFVITVAHVGPTLNDRFGQCKTVRFRVDTLMVGAKGRVEVEMGEPQRIEAGKASRIVHKVGREGAANLAAIGFDQRGFILTANRASEGCNLVASGLLFDSPNTAEPVPVPILPAVGRSQGPRN